MKTLWLTGLTDKEKEEIKADWAANAAFRQRLITILHKKQDTARKKRISEMTYETPNWELYQADSIGYERALNEIISILM